MARIKFTALVESIRGTIAGTTFQANAFGYTVKSKPNQVIPRSFSQNQRKLSFQKALQLWGTLTPAQRDNWNTYAATFPTASKNNPNAFLSGFNLFIRWHAIAIGIGLPTMTNPSGTQGQITVNEINLDIITAELVIEWDIGITEGPWYMLVYLSRPLKPTQTFVKSVTREIFFEANLSSPDDRTITNDYSNVFNITPASGDSVAMDVTFINTTNAQVIYLPSQVVIVG